MSARRGSRASVGDVLDTAGETMADMQTKSLAQRKYMVAEQLAVKYAALSNRHRTSVEVPVLLVSRGRASDNRARTVAEIEILLSQGMT